MNAKTAVPLQSIRKYLIIGTAMMGVLLVSLGVLGGATELSGAVVAPGTLVVDSSVKRVQHPSGGVIAKLKVRNGDRVRAGDLLLRLDATMAGANLGIVTKALDELAVRRARLESERDDAAQMGLPKALAARMQEADLRKAIEAEERLFIARRQGRSGQRAQFSERIIQLEQEIRGIEAQRQAKTKEIALIERELEGVRDLFQKKLVQLTRLTQLEREATRLSGEHGQLTSSVARARAQIAETKLQILHVDQEMRSEVAKELRDVEGKSAELVERKVAAEDQMKRIELRSPVDGVVHQSTVHTVGGVVGPAETLMLIVPDRDALVIEAKINPQDIDQVRLGLPTVLRFMTLNQGTTPEINGTVNFVSADLVTDQRTGVGHFVARISITDVETRRLGPAKLVPGLPIEAYIQTEARTILSYLAKPLMDQVHRAFRER